MTDAQGPRTDEPEIGSLGEEAVKLLGALSSWANEQQGNAQAAGAAGALGGLAAHAADAFGGVDEHLATGAAECTYCPICRAVHAVRQASPEVRAHLATATASLLQAAAGMLDTVPPDGTGDGARGDGVEHIDLDDRWPEDDT